MISKIAGTQDFIKHTEQKQKISFFKQLNDATKKVISSQKPDDSKPSHKKQETPADAFIKQKTSSDIKKVKLFTKE